MKFRIELFLLTALILLFKSVISNRITRQQMKEPPKSSEEKSTTSSKLVVIMLDGFRWDYFNNHKSEIPLPAFEQFIQEGVQAEWVEPIFPSVSYPSWTTINTGLFPESHGILGNYMYDIKNQATFELFNTSTTKREDWWQEAEPIWITATKSGLDVFLRYWSRCDVPFHGTIPKECRSGFITSKGPEVASETLEMAASKIKDHDLVMVYTEHIDNLGHQYGPNSSQLISGLKDIDRALNGFLDAIFDIGLEDQINVIITSDHGMIGVGPETNTTYLELGDYIDPSEVTIVLDRAAVVAIHPYASKREQVYEKLKGMPGVEVYKREEIPESYHYKNHRFTQEILLVAKRGYFIRGLNSHLKQVPYDDPAYLHWGGIHGYPNMKEMSGIFYAKGPAFKKGRVHPPIHLEDIYQVMAYVLNIQAQPHNGSWDRVASMFINNAPLPPTTPTLASSSSSIKCLILVITFVSFFRSC